jgi:hypothetical protein
VPEWWREVNAILWDPQFWIGLWTSLLSDPFCSVQVKWYAFFFVFNSDCKNYDYNISCHRIKFSPQGEKTSGSWAAMWSGRQVPDWIRKHQVTLKGRQQSSRPHGVTSLKTLILKFIALRTSNQNMPYIRDTEYFHIKTVVTGRQECQWNKYQSPMQYSLNWLGPDNFCIYRYNYPRVIYVATYTALHRRNVIFSSKLAYFINI